jgi:hypothetical protein
MTGSSVSVEKSCTADPPWTPRHSKPRCHRVRELGCAYPPVRDREGRVITVATRRRYPSDRKRSHLPRVTKTRRPLGPTKLRRKARHLHLKPFYFAHDGIFLELQPEPHLDERDASERER